MADEPGEEEKKGSGARLFIRDIIIAVVIVVLIIGGIFAYTQTWPPMVVVESNSMQHSDTESAIGVIDTGDLVLVQNTGEGTDIVTFLEGRHTGHMTYGDYGDVVIYNEVDLGIPGRIRTGTPIIHRAIVYLEWNEALQGYDIPALGLSTNNGLWGCRGGTCNDSGGPVGLTGTIWVGGMDVTHNRELEFNLDDIRDAAANWTADGVPYSGFITLGDNNNGAVDTTTWNRTRVTRLSPPDAIVGKARGEIPWFGLIKLTLLPTTNCCSAWGCVGTGGTCHAAQNSWDALVVSLVVLISIPVFADILLAYREKRKEDRKRATEEPVESPEDELPGEKFDEDMELEAAEDLPEYEERPAQ
jgi:signal peptidase